MGRSVNDTNEKVEAEALDWTIRVQRSDFADWDALTDWIDADPRHADSFNRLSLADSETADLVRQMPAPSRPIMQSGQVIPLRRRPIIKFSRPLALMAASFVLVAITAAGWTIYERFGLASETTTFAIATMPGETRAVRLPDGTQVALASATRLLIDPAGRHANLERGRAMFSVKHDPAHPFSVRLGDMTVTDVGTVFDLRRDAGTSDVYVAQGEVRADVGGQSVPLSAGHAVHRENAGALQISAIDPTVVGSWRRGQFSYDDAAITDVVADIEAVTGASIRVAPDIAGKRFAGLIHIVADPERTLRTVAPMLGVAVTREGDAWVLGSPADPSQR